VSNATSPCELESLYIESQEAPSTFEDEKKLMMLQPKEVTLMDLVIVC